LARLEGGVGLTNALHPRQKEIKKIDNMLGYYRKMHESICCGAPKKVDHFSFQKAHKKRSLKAILAW
jgi:hypothetical protein